MPAPQHHGVLAVGGHDLPLAAHPLHLRDLDVGGMHVNLRLPTPTILFLNRHPTQ